MRRITKSNAPEVLSQNFAEWTVAYLADPQNSTKKYRYRHPDTELSPNFGDGQAGQAAAIMG